MPNSKTILITGASSGIGRRVANRFAQDGASLILSYHQDQKAGEETVSECLRLGAKEVLLVNLDLNNDESINDFAKKVLEKFSQIDILVNNAGFFAHNNLVDQSFTEISQQINTNLGGLIKITKLFLPYIKEAVVNVGSALGLQGKGKLAAYSASKFGVRGFSQALAEELPNLLVYTVNPSLTDTKMGGPAGMAPEKVAAIIYQAALGGYKAKSGSDINVRDYQYGEFWQKFMVILRMIRNLI